MDDFGEVSLRSTLDCVGTNEAQVVLRVNSPPNAPEWQRWLEEIGFFPGEHLRVMARAFPGGDPLVVRIGQSTFALRRAEAACIEVAPLSEPEMAANAAMVTKGARS